MKRLLLSLCLLCLPPSALPAAGPLPQATLPAGCRCGCAVGGSCDCTDCPGAKADPMRASVRISRDGSQAPGPNGTLLVTTFDGSGTVVAMGRNTEGEKVAIVLTNRHVAPDGDVRMLVRWPNGKHSTATWLGCDETADLAALAALAQDDAACPPADDPPTPGQRVIQCGYPGQSSRPVRRDGVALDAGNHFAGGAAVLECDYQSAQGDSGSGVFTPDGRLLAVHWGRNGNYAGCVCHQDVRRFLSTGPRAAWFPRLDRRQPVRPQPLAKAPAGCPSCPGGQCPAPAKSRPPQSTLPPAVDEDAGDAAGCQVKVPVRCRGVNRTGQQCAWVSTATLARFLGVPAAAGLDADHTWALNGDPDQVSRELTRLGVRHRYQRAGSRDTAMLEAACKAGHGAAVGIGHGAHVVALVTFDRERNLVQTLSNNKPTRHVETWAGGVAEFLGSWNGWAVILEPEATGTPIACQAPPSRAAPCPAGNCGVPAARPMVQPGQDGTGRR